ncbi:hypothetical protein BHE74_00042469 [Ensete ventricosum]|nr:hypothetical protein BHE74_00042469 [Ensete ventricosum]
MGFPRFFVPTTQSVSRSNRAALARVMGEEGTRSPSVGAGLPRANRFPLSLSLSLSLRGPGDKRVLRHVRTRCGRVGTTTGLSVCAYGVAGGGGGGGEFYLTRANPARADVTRNHKSIPGEAATGAKIILELSGRSVDAMSNAPNAPKTHADDVISSATCLYLVPLFSFVLFFAGSNYEPKTRR